MIARINELVSLIDAAAKEAVVLPEIQKRISTRTSHISKLVIQQLQAAGYNPDVDPTLDDVWKAELESFVKALEDANTAMLAVENPGLLRRLLGAMWVNAQLKTAQDGLESAYKQLMNTIRNTARTRTKPIELPLYAPVSETTIIPTYGLALDRVKWSDVELLNSLTSRRVLNAENDKSANPWAGVFTAKVAGVQGKVMVKTYHGKKRDAFARLRQDMVLLNHFQSDVTPKVLSFSTESSQTPFIVLAGGLAIPFGDYLRRICETAPSHACDKAWSLITDILRVGMFLYMHVDPASCWAMIQPESLVVSEHEKVITDVPSTALVAVQSRPPAFNPLDVDIQEVLRSYFQHDLGLRPLRKLDIFPSMLQFTDRSNLKRPPPPPLISRFYFIYHPDPDGILAQQNCFLGDFGRFARGAKGTWEFVFVANVMRNLVVSLPNGAPKGDMIVGWIERGLFRASFPNGLAAIRKYGSTLSLSSRGGGGVDYIRRHGSRLAREHRVPPWAWTTVSLAKCQLPSQSEVGDKPCYFFCRPRAVDPNSRAYWTVDASPFSSTHIPARLHTFQYSQYEDFDFENMPDHPVESPGQCIPESAIKLRELRRTSSQFIRQGPGERIRRLSMASEDQTKPVKSLHFWQGKPNSMIFTPQCTDECQPFCDYPHAQDR